MVSPPSGGGLWDGLSLSRNFCWGFRVEMPHFGAFISEVIVHSTTCVPISRYMHDVQCESKKSPPPLWFSDNFFQTDGNF